MLLHAESDKILAQDSAVAEKLRLPDIFGATEDDTNSLRIVSLYEVSSTDIACMPQYLPVFHLLAIWASVPSRIADTQRLESARCGMVSEDCTILLQVDLDNLEGQFES